MKTMAYSSPSGSEAYLIACMKLSSNPDRSTLNVVLDATANGVAKEGTLISNRRGTFVGFPSREVRLKKEIAGRPNAMTDRIFVAHGILYQVMTIFPTRGDHSINVRKFQSAFKLTYR